MGRLYDTNGNDIGPDNEVPDTVGLDAPLPPTPSEVNPPPALPNGQTPAQLNEFAGLPGDTSSNQYEAEGMRLSNEALGQMSPFVPSAQPNQAAPNVKPDTYDFNVMGPGGLDRWNKAANELPKAIQKSFDDRAKAESESSDATAAWMKGEQGRQAKQNAIFQASRQQRQVEVDAKQKQVEEATTRYTNDLADKGQFWRNPGNIIAAIGAMFMTYGGKAELGQKMIQEAVMHDWNQRRQLADTHLGELKSNVAAYRQIAGDKNLGDQMALLESKKVALMEGERIAQSFQGPIAKAKWAGVAAGMQKDILIETAKLNSALGIFNQAGLENPYVTKAHANDGPNGRNAATTVNQPGFGMSERDKVANGLGLPPSPLGSASSSSKASGSVKQNVQSSASAISTVASKASDGGYMTESKRAEFNKRYPGSAEMIDNERAANVRTRLAEIGADPTAVDPKWSDRQIVSKLTPQQAVAYNAKTAAFNKDLGEDNKEIASRVAPIAERMAAYRRLGADLQQINLLAETLHTDPDTILGTRTGQVLGLGNVKAIQEYLDAAQPGTPHEKQARDVSDAISRHKQLLQYGINAYVKGNSGGTVSEGETKRNDLFIRGDHSWGSVIGFHNNVSSDARAAADVALKGAKSQTNRALWNIQLGQGTPVMGINPVQGFHKDNEPNMSVPDRSYSSSAPAPVEDNMSHAVDPNVQKAIDNLKGMNKTTGYLSGRR